MFIDVCSLKHISYYCLRSW